eukprot:GHVU01028435.1.p1 GENE.GHVU01028435.1~~GHVU01028435.1.p1  ORF type:complete len:148 (-),score=17.01 GHVU01028435.1:567-1010(-)
MSGIAHGCDATRPRIPFPERLSENKEFKSIFSGKDIDCPDEPSLGEWLEMLVEVLATAEGKYSNGTKANTLLTFGRNVDQAISESARWDKPLSRVNVVHLLYDAYAYIVEYFLKEKVRPTIFTRLACCCCYDKQSRIKGVGGPVQWG